MTIRDMLNKLTGWITRESGVFVHWDRVNYLADDDFELYVKMGDRVIPLDISHVYSDPGGKKLTFEIRVPASETVQPPLIS